MPIADQVGGGLVARQQQEHHDGEQLIRAERFGAVMRRDQRAYLIFARLRTPPLDFAGEMLAQGLKPDAIAETSASRAPGPHAARFRAFLRRFRYWFSLPTCGRRNSDLIREWSLSATHTICCGSGTNSTTIGSFVPSKLIFRRKGRSADLGRIRGTETVSHPVGLARQIGRGQAE